LERRRQVIQAMHHMDLVKLGLTLAQGFKE
jgi:hypothetical protein